MANYDQKADEHEKSGGDRAAFLEGWKTYERGAGLFHAMRQYQGEAQISFIKGWHASDDASPDES